MRTVQFQSVYEGILERHGLDPLGDAISSDTLRTIVRKINNRLQSIWTIWDWPEITVTEERAFRGVWNASRQFSKAGENEVFYIPEGKYYRIKEETFGDPFDDPPIGTLPTNTDYFEEFTPTPFIAYDQICKHSVGTVLGVYRRNPTLNGCYPAELLVRFRPSERGIDLECPSAPTVFLKFLPPPSKFTVRPHIAGKHYFRGELVFYTVNGECYRATADNNSLPSDGSSWTRIPFPELFQTYIEAGAYADSVPAVSTADDQAKLAAAQLANAEADGYIERKIDALCAQGQRHYYIMPWYYYHYSVCGYCCSQPWTGGSVTTLTDACESDWIYPPAPAREVSLGPIYHPEIVAVRTVEGTPSLEQVPTTALLIKTLVIIVIVVDGVAEEETWRLEAGPANPFDKGQLQPYDYNALSNNKHWSSV